MDILLIVFIFLPLIFLGLAFSGCFSKRVINKGDLLKYTNDFLELYEANEQEFQNELVEFKKIEKIKNILALIVESGLILMAIYELSVGSLWSLFLFLLAIGLSFAILTLNNKYAKKYKEMFKACIIKPYVEKSIPSLSYSPDGGINEEDYRSANFDTKPFNEIEEDDRIFGNIVDKVLMDMSEVKTINVKIRKNKKGKIISKTSKTQFHGMVAVLKSTKFNYGTIYIRKDKLKLLPERMRVKIDNPEFEKYFDVYSENRTEAKRLLDFQLVSALVKFEVESGLQFEMVIKGANIYLRFFTGPMFEPSALSRIKEKEMLWIYHMICDFIIQIQELLTIRENVEDSLIDKSIKSVNPFKELRKDNDEKIVSLDEKYNYYFEEKNQNIDDENKGE